jgi:hypothetical protein
MKEDQRLPETTEASVDWRKMPRNRPDKDEKHLAYSILIANGVQKEKAATMLGYSPRTVRSIDRALVKKSLKLELLSEQRIQRAHRVVDKILAGRTFGCIETVRASDSLRAAEAILDRCSPKSVPPPPPAFTFVRVNIDEARCDHQEHQLVDVTPEPGPASTTTERS